jgi:phosphatidylserine/phosphatidylglycerophosphate/cardiolipin synthase-like enzyme
VIETHTLTDGGQEPSQVAETLARFLRAATKSLDIAIYDFALSTPVEATVHAAIKDAAARGVAVRIAYNVDRPNRVPVPPPPRTDPEQLAAFAVPVKGINGVPHLMHQKYVIVDERFVWAGSANWTDDSWSREENAIVTLESPEIAASFERDFTDLWSRETVEGSGDFDPVEALVSGSRVRAWFSPGRGRSLAHRIAHAIGGARRRVRVASPVITSGPILGTLAEVASDGRVECAGVYDATQMREVNGQWRHNPAGSWKIPVFKTLIDHAPFSGKRSTPYAPGAVHDYMHAKVTVADDVTFIGSYNLSHAGEMNAENVLEIADAAVADRMAAFVDSVRLRYATPER